MAEHKLDIWATLRAIDCADGEWLAKQPEDARKAFSAYPVMRWAATMDDGPAGRYMVCAVNERVNLHLFDYANRHPELAFRLLASCGIGRKAQHHYLKQVNTRTPGNKARQFVADQYPTASEAEISMVLSSFTPKTFQLFLDECGVQPDDAEDILKAFHKETQSRGKAKV